MKNLLKKKLVKVLSQRIIITIIVMLILVSVIITMAVNGGLFGHAQSAGIQTNEAVRKEQELGNGRINIAGEWYNSPQEYVNIITGTTTNTDNCETCGNSGGYRIWICINENCDASPGEVTEGYRLEMTCLECEDVYYHCAKTEEELKTIRLNHATCSDPECGNIMDWSIFETKLCGACENEAHYVWRHCPDCDIESVIPDV